MEFAFDGYAATFFRALGLLTLIPFGEGIVAPLQRIAWAFGIALCVPMAFAAGEFSFLDAVVQFGVGAILGFPVALLVECAQGFGELFDVQRGQNLAPQYDPVSATSNGVTGMIAHYALWAMLLAAGALDQILITFFRSVDVLPLVNIGSLDLAEIGAELIRMVSTMMYGLLLGFFPLAVLFLLIDFGCAAIAKSKPGLQLQQEPLVIKSVLGLIVLVAALRVAPLSDVARQAIPSLQIFAATTVGGANLPGGR